MLKYILSKSYIVMIYSIKFGSCWKIRFGVRNLMYRHDNLQTIFHIVGIIYNCPYSYCQTIPTKKMLSTNSKTFFPMKLGKYENSMVCRRGLYLWHLQYCLMFFPRGVASKIESKTSLKYSFLKVAMTSCFRKAPF